MSRGGVPVRCACGVITRRCDDRDITGARSVGCAACGRLLAFAERCAEADYRAARKGRAAKSGGAT